MEKVMEVKEVELAVLESFPPKLRIFASGTVPTGGWTNPRLEPFIFIQPPPNGIYDFDFVADPPEGPATQVITPIEVVHLWDPLPEGVKGVRIHAMQNSKTALLDHSGHPDRAPTRYTFVDQEGVKRVVFFPRAFGPLGTSGEASLEYTGPEGHVIFSGEQITQQKTVLGTLISVALKSNMADEGFLDFALVLPPIRMEDEVQVEFKTIGILSHGPSGFGGFPPGAQRRYEVLGLEGIAEYIPIL